MNHATDPRAQQRLLWIRQALSCDSVGLQRASTDAGHRSYWRTSGLSPSHVLMDSPPGLEDVRPWLAMRTLLHSGGVRVPALLACDPEQGLLLLEDLGGPTLAQWIDAASADTAMQAAMAQLITLQSITPPAQMPVFGPALLQRDADLFEQWFLRTHLGLEPDQAQIGQLQQVHQCLADNALAQPQVLVHRDYMLRNLMPVADGPAVLDFQDMVVGPVAYDVASLMRDAFISWPEARVSDWVSHYHRQALAAGIPVPRDGAVFARDVDLIGVQRHLKILGIFCRLHYRDGKSRYIADLPRFIGYLDAVVPRHPALAPLAALLEQQIKPALARRGELQ